MSDEFLRVATQEINEELTSIETILKSCESDVDITKNCKDIEGHLHKIKGLSPMMGKQRIGKISEMLDLILKNMLTGKEINGIYEVLLLSNDFMQNEMKEQDSRFEELENQINEQYSDFL